LWEGLGVVLGCTVFLYRHVKAVTAVNVLLYCYVPLQ